MLVQPTVYIKVSGWLVGNRAIKPLATKLLAAVFLFSFFTCIFHCTRYCRALTIGTSPNGNSNLGSPHYGGLISSDRPNTC